MIQSIKNTEFGLEKYYYQIDVMVSTMGITDSFTHIEYFKDINLLKAREDAFNRYPEILEGIEKEGKYYLPFASPEDFVYGKNACYSVTLSFVEETENGIEIHEIEGEEEHIVEAGLDYEEFIIASLLLDQL